MMQLRHKTPLRIVLSLLFIFLLSFTRGSGQWEYVPNLKDFKNKKAVVMSVVAHQGALFALVLNDGMYKSTDNGDSWQRVTTAPAFTTGASYGELHSIKGVLYGSSQKVRLQRSTDNGVTWAPFHQGIDPNTARIRDYTIFNSTVFMVSGRSLYRLSEETGRWIYLPVADLDILTVIASNDSTIVVKNHPSGSSTCILSYSTNGGTSWTVGSGGIFGSNYFNGLFVGEDYMLIGGHRPIPDTGVIFRHNKVGGLPFFTNTVPHVLSQQHLFAQKFLQHEGVLFCAANFGVLRSTNRGVSWLSMSNGLPRSGSRGEVLRELDGQAPVVGFGVHGRYLYAALDSIGIYRADLFKLIPRDSVIRLDTVISGTTHDTTVASAIRNITADSMRIVSMSLSSPTGEFSLLSAPELLLAAGERAPIRLRFTPQAFGRRSADLVVRARIGTSTTEDTLRYRIDGWGGAGDVTQLVKTIIIDTIAFGGQTDTTVALLRNDRINTVTVVSTEIVGGSQYNDFIILEGVGIIDLAPGDFHTIKLAYVPQSPFPARAQIEIRLSDGTRFMLDAYAWSVKRSVAQLVSRIDFDTVGIDLTRDTTVTVVRNTGVTPVSVDSVRIESDARGEFTLTAGRGPGTLAANDAHSVTVSYAPVALDSATARLKIWLSNGSTFTVDLLGAGSEDIPPMAVVGDRETSRQSLLVEPNPAANSVRIRYRVEKSRDLRLHLYDAMSREVATLSPVEGETSGTLELDVSALSPGIYYLRLEAGGRTTVRPLVIMR